MWQFNREENIDDKTWAASLALGILKAYGVDSWEDLEANPPLSAKRAKNISEMFLSENDKQILLANPLIVRSVRAKTPLLSVAVCNKCGEIMIGGSKSNKCLLTPNCDGVTIRAKTASKISI